MISPFVRLLLSRGTGALGFQMLAVWIGFRIYHTTGSAVAVGGLGLSFFAANALAVGIGGVCVDRWFHRPFRSLVVLQTALALGAGGVFLFLSESPVALLFAGGALALIRQFRSLLYAKSLSCLAERGHPTANLAKWNVFTWQLALFLGPLLFSRFSDFPAVVPALSTVFLDSSAFFVPQETEAPARPPDAIRPGWIDSVVVGWRSLREYPLVFQAWILDAAVTLFVGATASFPFLLTRSGIPPEELGMLRAALALGSVCVSSLIPDALMRRHGVSLLAVSLCGVGATTALFPFATTLPGLVGLIFFAGAFDGISVVVRDEWLLRSVPRIRMGSVAAVTSLLISISDDLGEFESGIAMHFLGLPAALGLGALISIVAGAAFFIMQRARNPTVSIRTEPN